MTSLESSVISDRYLGSDLVVTGFATIPIRIAVIWRLQYINIYDECVVDFAAMAELNVGQFEVSC